MWILADTLSSTYISQKKSSRVHYEKAKNYFSSAFNYYERGVLNKAYDFYEKAQFEAQSSRKTEDLDCKENSEMQSIIYRSRDGMSRLSDRKIENEKLVKDNKIAKGMTQEEVKESWGPPSSIKGETWFYGLCLNWCTAIYFEEGICYRLAKIINADNEKGEAEAYILSHQK